MYDYCVLRLPSSETPGEVVSFGQVASLSDIDQVAVLLPGNDIIGKAYPGGDAYWDYSASPAEWFTRPPRPDPLAKWNYATKAWGAGDLTERRDRQWALIQAANATADLEDLLWAGHAFQVDAASRERLREALLDSMLATAAGETWSIDWTLADNTQLTMSAADMAAVHRALASRTGSNHERAQAKRALIYSSSTPEDIEWTSAS